MNIKIAGHTYEEIVEMSALIKMGGIKYEIMLLKLVELAKENTRLRNKVDSLNLSLDSIKEVIKICN